MRLPSGYGQIVKLGGKRRRPYAVRIEEGEIKTEDGRYVRKVKYLEYFENRRDAMDYLAKYNAGVKLDKKSAVTDLPTFEEIYGDFMKFYASKNKDASVSALNSYRTAYGNCEELHKMKFSNIRTDDLQRVISEHSGMSRSTVQNLIKLFHGMYKCAMRAEKIEKDYSAYIYPEYSEKEDPSHLPFTENEINQLWDKGSTAPLIMIYTGLRCTEFLTIENANIDLGAHIMRGGIKTAAGKNRIIPIHDAILPMVKDMMSSGQYLFGGDTRIDAHIFRNKDWNRLMKANSMKHLPHDTRHTAATLMEKYKVPLHHRKLILGHSVQDLTEGVYTHVDPAALVADINLIPSRFTPESI